ncbi:MAG: ferritin family protein [Anaerolineae bacterium]
MDNVLEALKRGMSTEIWGRRFYQQAVAHTEAEDGKKVFQSLVAEEQRHLDILRGQYAALVGEGDWISPEEARKMAESIDPDEWIADRWVSVQEAETMAEAAGPTEIFPEAKSAQQLIPEGASDEEALEMAMDFEQKGYDLYHQAAEDAEDAQEKAVWEFLAQAEDHHYTFLQKTHEFLANDGKWYFDDQELPFFEG